MSDAAVFEFTGSVVMLAGVFVFLKDNRRGVNEAIAGPVHIRLSTPSIIFFLVGAALFCFPFTQFFKSPPPSAPEDIAESISIPTEIPTTSDGKPFNVPALALFQSWRIYIDYCNTPSAAIENIRKALAHDVGENNVHISRVAIGELGEAEVDYSGEDRKQAAQGVARLVSGYIDRTVLAIDGGYRDPDEHNPETILRISLIGPKCVTDESTSMPGSIQIYHDKLPSAHR